MDFLVVLSLAVFATWAVRRRRSRPPSVPPALPARPSATVADQFEEIGFIPWPTGVNAKVQPDDLFFSIRREGCRACTGTVYELRHLFPGQTRPVSTTFGYACANCHHLVKLSEAPARVRLAWNVAECLEEFLEGMRRALRPQEESLDDRKTRLERELAETEARRNELRSQLLSVKNQLDEPDDGPPHR